MLSFQSMSSSNEKRSASKLLSDGARRDLKRIRAGYGEGTRNELRTAEHSEALELHKHVGQVVPMDEVELVFHLNGAVTALIEGGAAGVEAYGHQRGFSGEDVKTLCQAAMLRLRDLQERELDHSTALSKARYEELFRSTLKNDPRTAMRAQMNLDRVTGVGQTKDVGDTLRTMLEVMKSVEKQDPMFTQNAEAIDYEEVETQPKEEDDD